MSSQAFLAAVKDAVARPDRTRALLGHGSWVRGEPDSFSDCDLIEIFADGPPTVCSLHMDGVEVEVNGGTEAEIRSRLQRRYPHNNNFWLNALSQASLLLDHDGCGAALIHEALELRQQGPTVLLPHEVRALKQTLDMMLHATLRAFGRAAQSQPAHTLTDLRCGDLLMRAAATYYDLQQRWGNSFRETMRHAELHEPILFGFWMRYCHASALEEKVACVRELVSVIGRMEPANGQAAP